MRLDEITSKRERTLSFEFSPPRTKTGWTNFRSWVKQLAELGPDFMTVTYGAGGTTRDGTRKAIEIINEVTTIPAVAHLTCVGHTRDEIKALLDEYYEAGVNNVLALRGDPPGGETEFTPTPGGCANAGELIEFVAEDGRFGISCAAYPEGHFEAQSKEHDWEVLAGKFSAGASLAITQMFFDPTDYLAMLNHTSDKLGSPARIVPSVMPMFTWPSITQFIERFSPNTSLTPLMQAMLEPLGDDLVNARKVSLRHMVDMAGSLLRAGAPGIHVFAMNSLNRTSAAAELVTALRLRGDLD